MEPFRVAATFLRLNILGELQYRVNFFVQLLQSVIAVATGLVALALVFRFTDDLKGWSPSELMVVMGVHVLVGGILQSAVQPNMQRLIEDVHEGTLDYVLTKPADAQALVSVREFRLWRTVDVLVGGVVIAWASANLGHDVGPGRVVLFLAALGLGALMLYSLWLILTASVFWIIRSGDLLELFMGVYQAGRWPVGIYPGWLRGVLTFLVPVAFAVTLPAQAVARRLTPEALAVALVLTVLALLAARTMLFLGLRRYAGASA